MKYRALRRDGKILFSALEKNHSKSLLEHLNLLAHSALCDFIADRGRRKAPRFHEIAKDFQIQNVHDCDMDKRWSGVQSFL
jgi:hypothetical protein